MFSKKPKKDKTNGIIRVNSHGIALAMTDCPDETVAMIVWPEVKSIAAFKRDVFAYDLICLAIIKSDGFAHEVDEKMAGWDELIKVLPQHLLGFPAFENWFHGVAFPPFKTNRTILYERPEPEVKT